MSELASIISRLTDVLRDLQALQGSTPVDSSSNTRQLDTVHAATDGIDGSYSFVDASSGSTSTVQNTIVLPKIISKHDVAALDKKLEEYKRESDKAVADAQPKIPYQEVKLDKDAIAKKVAEYKRG